MLKFLLISFGGILVLWVIYKVLRATISLLAAPFTAIEARDTDARCRTLTAEEKEHDVDAESYLSFCDDVRALDHDELADFWAANENVPSWYASNEVWGDSGEAKLVRQLDDKRLFLCRARNMYDVIQSDAMSTVLAKVGTGTPVLCSRGRREWGYEWSVYHCTPEEYAKRKAAVEQIERAKVEKERAERRARLGLALDDRSSTADDNERR